MRKNRISVSVVAALAASFAAGLKAQVLEEVVVTAQKREQSLMDVPVSIVALSGNDLADVGITNVADIFYVAPSVSFQGSVSSSGQGMLVRGIGGGAYASGFESSVGTLIDGVVTGPGGAALAEFWDIDRVEVLRGPQGTLFGKNASAGAISIVTRKPTEEVEAELGVRWEHEYEEMRYDGVVSGPLTDNLSARLSVFSMEQDKGYVDNIVRDTTENAKDRWGARLRTRYDLDNFSFDMSLAYDEQDNSCCVRTFVKVLPDLPPAGLTSAFLLPSLEAYGVEATTDNRTSLAGGGIYETAETFHGVWELNWKFSGGHSIKSITGYRTWDQEEANDVDFLPVEIINGYISHDMTITTQEFQFLSPADARLQYVLGLYYYDQKVDETTIFDGGQDVVGVAGETVFDNTVNVENIAAFGQLNYRFTDQLSGFLGARILREDIDAKGQRGGDFFAFPGEFPAAQADNSDTDWIGSLGLQYFASEGTMYYASVSTGYKGSAIDTTIGGSFYTSGGGDSVLDPETVVSYELGARSELFDGAAQVSATLFYSEFEDFQSPAFDGAANSFVLRNAGKVETQGLELDIATAPWEGAMITFGLAWVDATFAEFSGAPCTIPQRLSGSCVDAEGGQDITGEAVNQAPEWQYTLSFNQDFHLASIPAYARVDYAWRDEVISDGDLDSNTTLDAYGVANLSLGILLQDKHDISLFVRNAFDEDYNYRIGDAPLFTGAYGGYPAPGRTWGIEARFRY